MPAAGKLRMAESEFRMTDAGMASPARRRKGLHYLGLLALLVAFCDPNEGFIAIPLGFILKNKLHFEAYQLSAFRLVAAIPLYFSFVFGFARDTWNPLGIMDRGYLVVFGAISVALYLSFAFIPATYLTVLAAIFLLTCAFLFIDSARYGLGSVFARQQGMSGQVSVLWSVFTALPTILVLVVGGHVSDVAEGLDADQAIRRLFILAAALVLLLAIYGMWKPADVFARVRPEYRPSERIAGKLKRLFAHRPIYPALLIWLLF